MCCAVSASLRLLPEGAAGINAAGEDFCRSLLDRNILKIYLKYEKTGRKKVDIKKTLCYSEECYIMAGYACLSADK